MQIEHIYTTNPCGLSQKYTKGLFLSVEALRKGVYSNAEKEEKDMLERTYEITMHTFLGPKRGTLTLIKATDSSELEGNLSLLGRINPITGVVNSDGSVRLFGQLRTIVRTVPFISDGTLSGEAIRMSLKDDRNTFRIDGRLIYKKTTL